MAEHERSDSVILLPATPGRIKTFQGPSISDCVRAVADLLDADSHLCLIGLWNTDFDSEGVSIQVAFDAGGCDD
jgi:hypothetical protein